jgi:hypothetical protein
MAANAVYASAIALSASTILIFIISSACELHPAVHLLATHGRASFLHRPASKLFGFDPAQSSARYGIRGVLTIAAGL